MQTSTTVTLTQITSSRAMSSVTASATLRSATLASLFSCLSKTPRSPQAAPSPVARLVFTQVPSAQPSLSRTPALMMVTKLHSFISYVYFHIATGLLLIVGKYRDSRRPLENRLACSEDLSASSFKRDNKQCLPSVFVLRISLSG